MKWQPVKHQPLTQKNKIPAPESQDNKKEGRRERKKELKERKEGKKDRLTGTE